MGTSAVDVEIRVMTKREASRVPVPAADFLLAKGTRPAAISYADAEHFSAEWPPCSRKFLPSLLPSCVYTKSVWPMMMDMLMRE
jgi:hypothetical protein